MIQGIHVSAHLNIQSSHNEQIQLNTALECTSYSRKGNPIDKMSDTAEKSCMKNSTLKLGKELVAIS